MKLMFAAFLSRVRHGSVFCAYCHDRLRVVIDGDGRYCSPSCREADGEQQAMSF